MDGSLRAGRYRVGGPVAATPTKTGLVIRSKIDENEHATGIKVTDDQMKGLAIRRTGFHGEWNYTLLPRR